MKERPILMSGAMVRATLREIDPKSQTRRGVKMKQSTWCKEIKGDCWSPNDITEWRLQDGRWFGLMGWYTLAFADCPYGHPGDRLWVRENGWERPERTPKMMREGADTWEPYYFDADGWADTEHEQFKEWGFKRRPSIHMPRWASRILLEIVSVRVERLQDISEEDAWAEGCWALGDCECTAKRQYSHLWESLNGPGSWNANPWVWVIEFKVVKV